MTKQPASTRPAWWRAPWRRLGRLDRREVTWLLIGLGLCVLLFGFVSLAGEVTEGDTQAFDIKILRALRDPSDLSKPIGPSWIEGPLLDLTSIGGPTVLGLVVVFVIGFLVLQTRYRTAIVVAIASIGGELLDNVMKLFFNRPRPTVVPHLRVAYSTSFPSGHAMESAIVYLTLARDPDAGVGPAADQGLHPRHRRAADDAGRHQPRVPRCALSDRCARRMDRRLLLGVDLFACRAAIRGHDAHPGREGQGGVRRLVAVAVLAAIAAVALYRARRPAAIVDNARLTWVADAHQLGPVGYRDPAGAISPDGRWIAYSEGRFLRVRPVDGGPLIDLPPGEAQIRNIVWDSRKPADPCRRLRNAGRVGDLRPRHRVATWILGRARSAARAPRRLGHRDDNGEGVRPASSWRGRAPAGSSPAIVNGREGQELWTITADGAAAEARTDRGRIAFPGVYRAR